MQPFASFREATALCELINAHLRGFRDAWHWSASVLPIHPTRPTLQIEITYKPNSWKLRLAGRRFTGRNWARSEATELSFTLVSAADAIRAGRATIGVYANEFVRGARLYRVTYNTRVRTVCVVYADTPQDAENVALRLALKPSEIQLNETLVHDNVQSREIRVFTTPCSAKAGTPRTTEIPMSDETEDYEDTDAPEHEEYEEEEDEEEYEEEEEEEEEEGEEEEEEEEEDEEDEEEEDEEEEDEEDEEDDR